MSFKVIKPGFLSTVQDYGRFGYAHQGMSQSGAMDEHAYAWGNYLLNNRFDDACIEMTFGGLEIEAQIDTFVAVTGADLNFEINGQSQKMWHSLRVNKGDRLSWGTPNTGVRSYLAVKGGFKTAVMFDSRSVNLRENIGNKILPEEVLPCKGFSGANYRFTPPKFIPNYADEVVLRVLPTYQFNEFNSNQKDLFFAQEYSINNASDRSGCRLDGVPIKAKNARMISEGVSYGAVEIAADGLPIIILKDGPSIGGYAKIGTVFSLDLAKLAQKQPNSQVRFQPMTMQDAQKERKQFERFFKMF